MKPTGAVEVTTPGFSLWSLQVLTVVKLLSPLRLGSPTSSSSQAFLAPLSICGGLSTYPVLLPFPWPRHEQERPLEGLMGEGTPGQGNPLSWRGVHPWASRAPGPCPGPSLADDTDANSNGSSGTSHRTRVQGCISASSSHSSSSGNGKDSALLETTESSKRCVWMGVAGSSSGLWSHLSWETGPSCWPLSPHRAPVASPLARTLRAHPTQQFHCLQPPECQFLSQTTLLPVAAGLWGGGRTGQGTEGQALGLMPVPPPSLWALQQ